MKWKILKKKKKLTPTDSAVSKLLKKKNVSWVASGEKSFFKRLCALLVQFDKRKMEISSTYQYTHSLGN